MFRSSLDALMQWSSTVLAPGTSFMEDIFSTDQASGRWLQDDSSALYLLVILLLCNYYISSTSDHQAQDPGDGGPLI